MMDIRKSYSELIKLDSYDERVLYLQLHDNNPAPKNRRLMNDFYHKNRRWKEVRDYVIIRDNGHDLGLKDEIFEIESEALIHHINPISEIDVLNDSEALYDPENLILVTKNTHNKIHFNVEDIYTEVERRPGDTLLW